MLVTKYCKMCGSEFEGRTNARYCTPACKREYETAYAKRWRDKNREHYREYQRTYQHGIVLERAKRGLGAIL